MKTKSSKKSKQKQRKEAEDVSVEKSHASEREPKNKSLNKVLSENEQKKQKENLIELLVGNSKEEKEKSSAKNVEEKSNDKKAVQQKTIGDKKREDLINMLSGSEKDKVEKPKEPVIPRKEIEVKSIAKQNENQDITADNLNTSDLLSRLVKQIVPKESMNSFIASLGSEDLTSIASIKPPAKTNPKKKDNDVLLIHWNGRFGNRMHTYAYLHNRAKKFGGQLYLPSDWEGKHLFNLDYKVIEDDELRLTINQSKEPFDNLNHRLEKVKEFNERSGYDFQYCNPDDPTQTYQKYDRGVCVDSVCAYHHKIFDEMKLADVLKLYEFNDEVKNLDIYKRMEDRQGTYDIAHLRRDDISSVTYSKNGGYSVISKDAYLKAFKKYDYDPDKIEWTTDDWTGKWGVGNSIKSGLIEKRGGWHYPVGAEFIEGIMFDWFPDFLRLYFARTIFRANSSFSFWACTLAKGRKDPPKIFAPRLNKRVLYAKKETYKKETYFNFEEGNHPHWLCLTGKDNCDNIVFEDETLPKKYQK